MPDTAIALGPVVRMCEDTECQGWNACPAARRDQERVIDRTLGLTDFREAAGSISDEGMCVWLAREIARNYSTDSHGVKRMIPDGCEFRVHKFSGAALARWYPQAPTGGVAYVAIYSGAATCIDDILGDAPEYDEGRAIGRVLLMDTPRIEDLLGGLDA